MLFYLLNDYWLTDWLIDWLKQAPAVSGVASTGPRRAKFSFYNNNNDTKGGSVAGWFIVLNSGAEGPGFKSRSVNSLRQTVHTHRASVHQAAKLVAAILWVAGVTAGLAESNGSLPPGLWLTSPAGWLPRTVISSGTLRSVIEYGLPLSFF